MPVCHIALRKKGLSHAGLVEKGRLLSPWSNCLEERLPRQQVGAGRGRGEETLQGSRGAERLLSKEQGAELRPELYTFFLRSKRGPRRISATKKDAQWTEMAARWKDPDNKVTVGRRGVVYEFIFISVALHLATELS